MTDASCTQTDRLELLRELFASATHDASAAMCRWTEGLITVTLDEVQEIPLEDVASELKIGDELLTMVVLALQGEVGGNMILVFDETNGRQLAASLLGRQPGTDPQWSELEISALTETGNILGCAYMNALTRLIDTELFPSAPYFIQDYGISVLQQALMAQAMTGDDLLICRIGFRRKTQELDWRVIFVPNQGMRQALEGALHSAA
ncbi:MAG TPA: chemotaxis protein [Planctomycetes bacterium]|nr:chemotaxis protein [Planctomycetota bacterium]